MNKKALFNFLRVVVSIGLIAFLFWLMRGSLGQVGHTIKKVDKTMLFLSFVIFTLGMALMGIRLRFIMKAQNMLITFADSVYLTFIGLFFNNFLPTSAGGDLVKIYYAAKKTGKKMPSAACVIFDRLLGSFTLILMVLIASIFIKDPFADKIIKSFLAVALVISFIIILILFNRRVAKKTHFLKSLLRSLNLEEKIKGIYEIINNYKEHPRLLLSAVFFSAILQLINYYALYLVAVSLKLDIPIKFIFLLMPIISTAGMMPSINGIGPSEATFVLFFGPMVGKGEAFAFSILCRGLTFAMSIIGGLFYLFQKQHKTHKEGDIK